MKATNLTRQHSLSVSRGLVVPTAARSFSWVEDMVNGEGADIPEGSVVVVVSDGTVELADTLNDPRPTGVALDTIDDGETGQVCFGGPVDLVLVTASVTAGQYGQTSTTPGEAQVSGSAGASFCMFTDSGTEPSAFLWGGRGGGGVVAGTVIEGFPTDETDVTLVLHPDGTGGIEWGVDATGGSGSLPWFVVTDSAYGAVGDGSTNDTAAINLAIAALVSAGGGVLYFPATPDSYKVTAGLTALSVPCLVLGDGAAGTPSAQDDALSRITFDDDTGVLFSVTANHVAFIRIALHYVGSTPSAGAGIQVPAGGATRSRGYFGQYHQISVKGFWINVDLQEGGQWAMTDSQIRDPKKYGIRTLNTTSPDEGDWSLSGIQFDASGLSPDAALRVESGGGGKVVNSKVNGSTSTGYARGIDVAIPNGISTSVFLVSNCSIENLRSGNGINIATAGTGTYNKIVLNGIQFSLNGSGSAINISANTLGEIVDVLIDNILGTSSANAAPVIALTKVQTCRIGAVVNDGFTGTFTQSGSSGVVDDTGSIAAGVAITGTPSSGDIPIASSGTAAAWGAPSASGITVQDEGTPLSTSGTTLNFVGAGVVASGTGATKTITIAGSSVSALDDLSDVVITSATSGDRLRYSGSSWVNSALRWEPHVAYDGTVVLDGNGDPVMVEVS